MDNSNILSHKKLLLGWFICLLGALFYTYEYLLRIEPSIMIAPLSQHFALDATGIGLLASAYYWAYTPLQIFVGLLLDRFGTRRTLLFAVSSCIVGVFAFGFTSHLWLATAGRFLIGLGSAFAFVGSLKLCVDWLPKKYFAFFAGLCTSLGMIGAIFGETAMSYVVDKLGWHSVIVDSLWLGVILLGIFVAFLHERKEPSKSIEIDFTLLLKNIFAITRNKKVLQAGFIGCALYLSLSLLGEQWGISFIQKILNNSTQSASYFIDMIFLGWLIGSPIQGLLSEKIGSRRHILMIGTALSTIVILPLLICPLLLSKNMLSALLFLFAFFTSAEINCFAVCNDIVEPYLSATTIGFLNACIMIGGMIIQPFFAFCLDLFAKNHTNSIHGTMHHTLADYQHALWIIPIFTGIAFFVAFKMKE